MSNFGAIGRLKFDRMLIFTISPPSATHSTQACQISTQSAVYRGLLWFTCFQKWVNPTSLNLEETWCSQYSCRFPILGYVALFRNESNSNANSVEKSSRDFALFNLCKNWKVGEIFCPCLWQSSALKCSFIFFAILSRLGTRVLQRRVRSKIESGQISHSLAIGENRGGVGEISESIFHARPRNQPTFDRSLIGHLADYSREAEKVQPSAIKHNYGTSGLWLGGLKLSYVLR